MPVKAFLFGLKSIPASILVVVLIVGTIALIVSIIGTVGRGARNPLPFLQIFITFLILAGEFLLVMSYANLMSGAVIVSPDQFYIHQIGLIIGMVGLLILGCSAITFLHTKRFWNW